MYNLPCLFYEILFECLRIISVFFTNTIMTKRTQINKINEDKIMIQYMMQYLPIHFPLFGSQCVFGQHPSRKLMNKEAVITVYF